MNDTVDLSGPTACPRCTAPVLVRRHAGSNGVIITLDADPISSGTYMVMATTASVVSGRGGWRYRLHTCPTAERGIG